jgi:hypothetical protein
VRAQIIRTLLTWSLVGSQQGIAAESEPHRPADRAFRIFAALPPTSVESALESLRPLPISSGDKRRALSSLPSEGELQPTPDEAAKLSKVQRVLISTNGRTCSRPRSSICQKRASCWMPVRSC